MASFIVEIPFPAEHPISGGDTEVVGALGVVVTGACVVVAGLGVVVGTFVVVTGFGVVVGAFVVVTGWGVVVAVTFMNGAATCRVKLQKFCPRRNRMYPCSPQSVPKNKKLKHSDCLRNN